jgi:hypothetical protein
MDPDHTKPSTDDHAATPAIEVIDASGPIDPGQTEHSQSNLQTSSEMTAVPPEVDPFDLSNLRISQDFASVVGVQRVITTIPVRKPSKEWYIRCHPDEAYRIHTSVLELKEEGEIYLVAPRLRDQLADEVTVAPRLLMTAINRQGVLFLWPVRLPGPDGRIDEWNRSAKIAADEARARWIRVRANRSLNGYDVHVATGIPDIPDWPALDLQEIMRIAFRDRMISDWDHPVLRRLRGEG